MSTVSQYLSVEDLAPDSGTYLAVPYSEKEQAKELGARWDPKAQSWYVPPDIDVEPFAGWLAVIPLDDDPLLEIVGLPQPCWKCGELTMAVIACKDKDQLIFANPDVLQVIASQLSAEDLAEVGAGPLRPRFSNTVEHSSWSNGCVACGVLLGGFPSHEDFVRCQSDTELELPVIASARISLELLYGEAAQVPDTRGDREEDSLRGGGLDEIPGLLAGK
jgi:hypothetical protein